MNDSTIFDAVKRLREAAPTAETVHIWLGDHLNDNYSHKAGTEYTAHISWGSSTQDIFESSPAIYAGALESVVTKAIARAYATDTQRDQKIASLRAELAKLEAEQTTNNERTETV